MSMSLDQFAARCRDALKAQPGTEGRQEVCTLVQQALRDPDFVTTHITEDGPARKVLYEDPELGFTILAHTHPDAKTSGPHDHGPSWAIYGQAAGETLMSDYDCVERPGEGRPGKARKVRDYAMRPGDVHLYDPGVLHSPRRDAPTRLLRIEGMNMERVKRLPYEAV